MFRDERRLGGLGERGFRDAGVFSGCNWAIQHRQTLLMKGLVALSSLRNRTAFHFIRKATVFSHWKQILGVSAAVL